MGTKSKIFIGLLTVTVLYGGYYFGIPAVLNRPGNVDFLKTFIKKEYGFDTRITNPRIKMGYLPAIWIKADGFEILNNDNSEALSFKGITTRVKLLPLILNGFCPIASAILVGALSTIITIYLVGGFNSKSTSAIIGTMLSLIFAGALSMLAIFMAHLTGFAGEETIFLYGIRPDLNFQGILSAAMIIAALGALMDTSVSIASTINEIHETDNSLGVMKLFQSGMNVGRDVIGTMSNTLILVYMGSSLPLVLLANNIDLQKFFNLNQVSTEILSAIIGSIAILACVPITAIISAYLIKHKKNNDIEFKF